MNASAVDLGTINGIVLGEYERLIQASAHKLSRKFRGRFEPEEFYAAGWMGLRHAAQRFDPARELPFEKYASSCVRGFMLDVLRSNNAEERKEYRRAKREGREYVVREIACGLGSEGESPLSRIAVAEEESESDSEAIAAKIERLFDELRPRDRDIARARIMDERTLADIGAEHGISLERVRQIVERVGRRLAARWTKVPAPTPEVWTPAPAVRGMPVVQNGAVHHTQTPEGRAKLSEAAKSAWVRMTPEYREEVKRKRREGYSRWLASQGHAPKVEAPPTPKPVPVAPRAQPVPVPAPKPTPKPTPTLAPVRSFPAPAVPVAQSAPVIVNCPAGIVAHCASVEAAAELIRLLTRGAA